MSLMGIDIGTTGCKAAAFSQDGSCVATSYREYPTLYPREGWMELDSRQVIQQVFACIADVAAHSKRDPITAMCISSMGEAMTPISAKGEILGNSILHTDLRGGEYVEKLSAEIGQQAFYAINPNIIGPNYSLPKLLWLKDHQPDIYNGAWKLLLWADLVGFMLGGEPLTSFSLANRTLLFDIHKEDWSEQLLGWSGLDREKFPKPVPGGTLAGHVSSEMAARLGLPDNVQIVVGGHDQCCNSLGAGIFEAGKACCGIGTVECIAPVYGRIPTAEEMLPCGLNVEHHVLKGLYVSFIYNQSGVLVRWFRDTFAAADKLLLEGNEDLYDILMRELPPEPTRLLVLPHFEITGTPDFIADSAGVIAGLRTTTTRGEILKAIMESSTMYFLESLDALKAMGIDMSGFVATGGGAKSAAWLQIKADVLGVPFVRPRITECGMLGAAILAGVATHEFSGVQEGVENFVNRDRVFEPNAKRHQQYQELYQHYRQLYPAMKGLLKDLSDRSV